MTKSHTTFSFKFLIVLEFGTLLAFWWDDTSTRYKCVHYGANFIFLSLDHISQMHACDHHVISLYKDGDSYSPSFAPARDANNHFIFLTLSIWNWNKLVEWCILNFNTRTRWSETVRSGIRIQNTKAVNDNFYIFKKQKWSGMVS